MKLSTLSRVATSTLALSSTPSAGSGASQNKTGNSPSLNTAVTRNHLRGLRKLQTSAYVPTVYPEGCVSTIEEVADRNVTFQVYSGTKGFCTKLNENVIEYCPGTRVRNPESKARIEYDPKDTPGNFNDGYFRTLNSPLYAYVITSPELSNYTIGACVNSEFMFTVPQFFQTKTPAITPAPTPVPTPAPWPSSWNGSNDNKQRTLGLAIGIPSAVGVTVAAAVCYMKKRANSRIPNA